MNRRTLLVLAGASGLMFLTFTAAVCGSTSTTVQNSESQERGINVSGEGIVQGEPDIAAISLGVSTLRGHGRAGPHRRCHVAHGNGRLVEGQWCRREGHPDGAALDLAGVRLHQRRTPTAARLPCDQHAQRQAARHRQDRRRSSTRRSKPGETARPSTASASASRIRRH